MIGVVLCEAQGVSPAGMQLIPAGKYQPLYKIEGEKQSVSVDSFYIDVYPVTNGDFLKFVKANPKWVKSKASKLFVDNSYLRHWKNDTTCPIPLLMSPVVNISWFAAKAYAKWKGKRLPSQDEWELVGSSSETKKDASKDSLFIEKILKWYSKPNNKTTPKIGSTFKNYYGVSDMHGLVWEWIYDFNSVLVTGESRADNSLERSLYCGAASMNSANVFDYASFMRYGFRSSLKAKFCIPNLGFRCAKN